MGCTVTTRDGRLIDPITGMYIERRVRTGTIADRRDQGTIARKKWARVLNIAFVVSATCALIGPAILGSYLGVSVHTTVSGSMRPTIQPGDMLIAKIHQVRDIKVGDIVMLMNQDSWQMQAHRVISKDTAGDVTTVTTKGDANNEPDKAYTLGTNTPIREVSTVVPKFGYVLNALATTTAKAIGGSLLIIINILIVTNVLVKRRKTDAREPLFKRSSSKAIEKENSHVG